MGSKYMPRGPLMIADHDPAWIKRFSHVKEILLQILGSEVDMIEHIGSTAIPKLAAKPIIDILIVVENLNKSDFYVQQLKKLGYTYRPDQEKLIPERRYFVKYAHNGEHTHHIHLVEEKGIFWKRHLAFRNYLRKHDEVKNAYMDLKRDLQKKHKNDRLSYQAGKAEFIEKYEKIALEKNY